MSSHINTITVFSGIGMKKFFVKIIVSFSVICLLLSLFPAVWIPKTASAANNKTITYTIRANDTSKFVIKNKTLKIKCSWINKLIKENEYYSFRKTKKRSLSLRVNRKTKYWICDIDNYIDSYTAKGRVSSYKEIKNDVDTIFKKHPYADAPEGYWYVFIKEKNGMAKSITMRFLT